jgi:hypothetical protein
MDSEPHAAKPTVKQRLSNAAEDGKLGVEQYVRVVSTVVGLDDGCWVEIEQDVSAAARDDMIEQFNSLDEDGNGFLSVDEVEHGLNGTLDQARQVSRERDDASTRIQIAWRCGPMTQKRKSDADHDSAATLQAACRAHLARNDAEEQVQHLAAEAGLPSVTQLGKEGPGSAALAVALAERDAAVRERDAATAELAALRRQFRCAVSEANETCLTQTSAALGISLNVWTILQAWIGTKSETWTVPIAAEAAEAAELAAEEAASVEAAEPHTPEAKRRTEREQGLALAAEAMASAVFSHEKALAALSRQLELQEQPPPSHCFPSEGLRSDVRFFGGQAEASCFSSEVLAAFAQAAEVLDASNASLDQQIAWVQAE